LQRLENVWVRPERVGQYAAKKNSIALPDAKKEDLKSRIAAQRV
jgi:hypothetical protein